LTSSIENVLSSTVFTDVISHRDFLDSFASSPGITGVCCEGLLRQQQVALSKPSSSCKIFSNGFCWLLANGRVHAESCLVQHMGQTAFSKNLSLPFVDDPFDSDFFETVICSALGSLHHDVVSPCKAACQRAVQLAIFDFADSDVLSVIENQTLFGKTSLLH
jgi:hypothetical protein